ncbi:MAG TPA: DUF2225 domain-containing protein [Gemmatimonadaceae bacterium]|jgi:uncharacterized protein (DUF2225 family)|nr:DUF2225 domain-containing protein [Gemmatimonadaceae bacterium]
MTALRRIALCCPSCGHEFRSQVVISTDPLAAKSTDFHERAAGTPSLPYQVHMCDQCGYAGTERDFTEPTDVSPVVREHIWTELSPQVRSFLFGSEKYEAAAKVAIWQGADPRRVAELLLRAAWCCVEEEDLEAERYFRRKAAWAFEQALDTADLVPDDERAVLAYLIGELWRRIGDVQQASLWFERVANEVVDSVCQTWIVDAAQRQQTDPREWFG